MKTSLILIALMFSGCANPAGSSWWVTDFNKYDQNYSSFPTNKIRIGLSRNELKSVITSEYSVVEAGEGYEVIAYQRWTSVTGPDYVDQTLYIRLVNDRVKNWKITNDAVAIVPRSW